MDFAVYCLSLLSLTTMGTPLPSGTGTYRGLRLTAVVNSVNRQRGEIRLNVAMQFEAMKGAWLLNDVEPMVVVFHDQSGKEIGFDVVRVILEDEFVEQRRGRCSHVLTVQIPPGSSVSLISVHFGRSGLKTLPITIK